MTDRSTGKAAAYVLGALEEKERREFETRLKAQSPAVQTEVEELRAVAAFLPTTLRQQQPSPRVRERIMGAVREESRSPSAVARDVSRPAMPKPRSYLGLSIGVAFAAIVLVVGFGLWVNSLLQTIDEQNVQITELKSDLDRQQEVFALLQSPEVNIVIMNGRDPSPEGHGKIMWDPDQKKALLYITNLPVTPPDKDYQLWQIVDRSPVSAGVFSLTAEGEGYFKVEPIEVTDLKRVNGFAVTLEPKGGVPQPTGKMYLVGRLRF